jgi:glucosamine-phosphate N-acetyltransferase
MPLFAPSLIPAEISSQLPQGYTIRPLHRDDYANGFLDVLRVLTAVGDISKEAWEQRFEWMQTRNDEYFVVCVLDTQGVVVGVGSLVVERKL